MNLRVETSNGQEGDNSVETIKVYDGEQLLAEVKKVGDNRAELTAYEALNPERKGAFVEIQNGADVAQAISTMQDETAQVIPPTRRLKIGK